LRLHPEPHRKSYTALPNRALFKRGRAGLYLPQNGWEFVVTIEVRFESVMFMPWFISNLAL